MYFRSRSSASCSSSAEIGSTTGGAFHGNSTPSGDESPFGERTVNTARVSATSATSGSDARQCQPAAAAPR